jgi:hypothetical protein
MSDITSEKQSSVSSRRGSEQALHEQMEHILFKLKTDPSSITTEDARRLSENYNASDEKSARIISAVEAFALANEQMYEQDSDIGQPPHTSLTTLVQDLQAAVDATPDDVTTEVLRTTQSIVSSKYSSLYYVPPE